MREGGERKRKCREYEVMPGQNESTKCAAPAAVNTWCDRFQAAATLSLSLTDHVPHTAPQTIHYH